MRWLNKLPDSIRSASGLEWRLWRKLPLIALVGTALPLLVAVVMHLASDDDSAAQFAIRNARKDLRYYTHLAEQVGAYGRYCDACATITTPHVQHTERP